MVEIGRHVSVSSQWERILGNPFVILQSILDTLVFWLRSRNWRVLVICFPVIAILCVYYFMLISQSVESNDRLVQRFTQNAQTLVSIPDLSTAALIKIDKLDTPMPSSISDDRLRKLDVLLKRVLSMNPSETQSVYSMAMVKEIQGDTNGCDELLKTIAPEDSSGFAPAHCILSAKLIRQFDAGNLQARDLLVHHLEQAVNWSEVEPRFLVAYSRLIENPRSRDKVMDLLKRAASRDPEYYLQLAYAARRMGLDTDCRLAAEKALKHFEKNLAANPQSTKDLVAVSKSNVLLGKFTEDKTLLRDALANPELDQTPVKRELSEVFRAEYYATLKKEGEKTTAKLGLLESAATTDPTNSAVAEDVSLLYAANLKPTVALLRCLKQHVDDGTATTATFFNLSNEYAKREKYSEAITYLEKAIELAPNSFEAQNNLALLLARHNPEKIERAVELIEKAYATAPSRPEVNDSYGEILLIAKRPMDAISKLTSSLNTNKSRVGTRKLLIRAFDEAGLPEMAQTHRDILKQLEATE